MSSINNKPPPPLTPFTSTPVPGFTNPTANQAISPAAKVEQQQAEKVAENQPLHRNPNAAEAERIASQAGFTRTQKKKRHGFELDDVTQVPIPLPVDEVDETAWEQGTLDDAQKELTLQAGELSHLAESVPLDAESLTVFASLVERAFKPTEQDIGRMQALEQRTDEAPVPEVSMNEVQDSLNGLFNLNVSNLPQGPRLVATALVVAGMASHVQPQDNSLEPKKFCEGMQKLVDKSSKAVNDARGMSSGINQQLAAQRTFVFKR